MNQSNVLRLALSSELSKSINTNYSLEYSSKSASESRVTDEAYVWESLEYSDMLMFPYSTTTSFWFHTIHTSTSISIFGICNFYFHSIKVCKQAFNSEPSYAEHGLVQHLWFNTCHFQSWLHKSGIVLVKSTGDCESVKGFYLLLKSIALRIISLSSSQNRWLPKHTDLKWLSFVFYLHLLQCFLSILLVLVILSIIRRTDTSLEHCMLCPMGDLFSIVQVASFKCSESSINC